MLRIERVATGSVSKRYQTSLSAQRSKPLLENVSFDLIYPMFNSQKPPSKILVMEYTSQGKMFRATSWVRTM